MTPRARRNWKIIYFGVVPATVLAIDVALYVHMKGWQYNVKADGRAAFWPGLLLLGAMLFPIIAAALSHAIFELASARLSTRWPAVEGRVTDSAIKPVEQSRRAWIGWETYYTYQPTVAYAYEAAGRPYNNDLIAFGLESFDTREEAEAILAGYPKGAPVRVHYDPDDPQSSVLQMAGGWAWRAIVSALVALLAIFWLMITVVTWP
jgi:hypothetical protein